MRDLLLAGLLVCPACALDPVEPAPGLVEVLIERAPEITVTAPIRYAVVWTLSQGMVVTADGAVGGAEVTEVTVQMPLELPPDADLAELDPLEEIELVSWGDEYPSFRPRLVVYEDLDRDGAFAPPVLDGGGSDRVLGIDEGQVVAVLDLDAALEELSLEEAGVFYRETGDAFTAFFRYWEASSSYYDPSIGALGSVSIDIDDPELAELDLACKRELAAETLYYNTEHITVDRIDVRIDPLMLSALCGVDFTDCATWDFDVESQPPLAPRTYPRPTREYQCRHNSVLDVLLQREIDVDCEGCDCGWVMTTWRYITLAEDPPGWWPCGESIEYCETEYLTYFDPDCTDEI